MPADVASATPAEGHIANEAALSATQKLQLEEEATVIAGDIMPWFMQSASAEDIWSPQRSTFVSDRRSAVYGKRLFFDELLSLAAVDSSLYPPRSSEQLSTLLRAIFGATNLDYLKQLSLVYYLVLDLDHHLVQQQADAMTEDAVSISSKAQQFASTFVVLPQFCEAMRGYWLLDNDRYEDAVPLLSIADFIPKIVRTLSTPSSASDTRSDVARSKLLLRFLRTSTYPTSSVPGSEEHLQEIELQITATCFVSGPTRALAEIRALTAPIRDDEIQRVSIRARLIFKVLEHCFAPPRSAAIQNLLACSLDPEEEVALESFVLSPPPAMTATWSYVAADALIIRYINQGRYMDAVGLDRRLGPDVSQGHSSAKSAHERSKMMEQRKRMITGAREILPEVQKELLRIEESVELSNGGSNAQQTDNFTAATTRDDKAAPASPYPTLFTPLSASPATRRSATQTPTTQAAILSAVVRASASPSTGGTPSKAATAASTASLATLNVLGTPTSSSKQQPIAMIGFLTRHSLDRRATSPSQCSAADAEGEAMEDIEGSGVLVPTASELAASDPNSPNIAADKQAPSALKSGSAASPWRNKPTLTSTSPFSGQPKIPKLALGGSAGSNSFSPYRRSPGSMPATNTSPFAAVVPNRSMSDSPSAGGTRRLPGVFGVVSQQTRRSRLGFNDANYHDEMDDEDLEAEQDEDTRDETLDDDDDDGAEDTFIAISRAATGAQKSSGRKSGDISIGRLIPGRRGWNEANGDDEGVDEDSDNQLLISSQPPAKRRTRSAKTSRSAAVTTTPARTGKLTRSQTGAHLSSTAPGTPGGKMSQSRSDAALTSKRSTRSTSAANRKPLTLSNLEQHSAGTDTAPIARRTRAATAELESLNGGTDNGAGDDRNDATSTIYTISEAGDDAPTSQAASPVKRRTTRKTTATKKASGASVRRSSRLTSVEPETAPPPEMSEVASPAKRRVTSGRRAAASAASKMPGGLD
ncbi:hypothetical protein BCV70DRAFT_197564 [Testicularia cyperi]|uniref:ELYS-like domain-containing protein n=1 Tax=Testicularia cyperi TaxID=1882483 RepID=A0A317Y151_9BASI|nr:hypothetical protein BCV70DRAFT_197564 [Testicularia cyperi]